MRVVLVSFAIVATLVTVGCATEKKACDAPGGRAGKGDCAGDCAGKGGGCPMEAGASPTAVPSGATAVQNEMRLLNHAVHLSMTAAALGDVSIVPGLFHQVHQARALTDQAVAAGTWKPAKGDVASFQQKDAAFHTELEGVVKAAAANDRTGVVDGLNRLLPSCVACHDAHREPGLPPMMQHMKKALAEHPEHPKGAEHPEHPKGAEHPKHD